MRFIILGTAYPTTLAYKTNSSIYLVTGVILPYPQRYEATKLRQTATTFFAKFVEVGLSRLQGSQAVRSRVDDIVISQKVLDVDRHQERVDTQGSKRIGPRVATEPAPMLFEVDPQANDIVFWPVGDELPKTAALASLGVGDHKRVLQHGFDLAVVANNPWIAGFSLEHVLGHHQQALDVEVPEDFFEVRPFVINDSPYETRLKDLARELREVAV